MPEDEMVRAQKLYLFRQELGDIYKIRYGYWDSVQSGKITTHHRRELIRWLYQLVDFFRYESTESFQLAVNYLDRVCSKYVTHLSEYQALGAACFLIAAKACEPHPPTCSDMARLSAGAYDVQDLKDTELTVLQVLRWNLNAPTPALFLDSFMKVFPLKKRELDEVLHKADTYVAVIQSDYHFMRYRPSVQTAAALQCAFKSIGRSADVFHAYMTRELDSLSLDTAAIVSGLELPQLREINECARLMSKIITPTLAHMQTSHPRAKNATKDNHNSIAARTRSRRTCTNVKHGLATPPPSDSPNENEPPQPSSEGWGSEEDELSMSDEIGEEE
ncbi:G1/S-specific cyclin-D1, partial [Rhizophlyctis rosea]